MEERVKTSFIPKTSLQSPEARRSHGDPAALANLVTGVLLVLAIAAAGGLYAFLQYTNAQLASKQQSLSLSREAFQPATIEELARLDTRITVAKQLLAQHLAVSQLFDELEKLTLSSVRYTNFDYSVAAPGHVVLTMSGTAASYNAVALQSDTFAQSSLITDPMFSNVNVGQTGNVTFDFTGVIDASHMLYSAPVSASSTAPLGGGTTATSTP